MWSARKAFISSLLTIAFLLSIGWFAASVQSNGGYGLADGGSDPLSDLDRRISLLEKSGPFVVVDRQGNDIFVVEASPQGNRARVFNSFDERVASFGADVDGGFFRANDSESTTLGGIGFENGLAGLNFYQTVILKVEGKDEPHNKLRLTLGRGEAGNYSLRINDPSGNQLAGIGESKAGSGAILVGDSQSAKLASLFVGENSKGLIGIFTGAGNAVASFGEATGNTGGSLVLGDDKSEPRVKMGTNDLRYGVVMALPQGLPYVPRSGLPGSYLLGCAGGSSCVP